MQVRSFASRSIINLRSRLGLTQPEFGQLFGIHWMTVSKWERGLLEPTAYQTALMNEFLTATKKREVDVQVKAILIGMGIAAALFFLLSAARK